MKARITFTEELMGTLAGNKEIAKEFIASKNPNGNGKIAEDENTAIDSMDEQLEKSSTVFPRTVDGVPFLYDYQVKGFLKEACKAMIDMDCFTKEELKKYNLTNYTYKRTIDNLVFVKPRIIPIIFDGAITWCERPLRANTQQGERIALARSEQCPAGSYIDVEIVTLNPKLNDLVRRWLDYGNLKGLGQWRNSGKGRFEWTEKNGQARKVN